MNQQEQERFRDRLLAEEQRLREEVESIDDARVETARPTCEVSDTPTHAADHDAEGLAEEVALEKTLRGELRDVRQALERVREGCYGVCQRCGKMIDTDRLAAIPYTPYCRKCEQARESV